LPTESFSVAIVGPGTGLGTAGLLKRNGQLIPLVGEGGHIGFAPKSKTQIEILGVLRDKFERVCVERLLSGSGIENIYWALHSLRGDRRKEMSAADIFRAAGDGSDAVAADAAQLFFEILGQVAGDIALVMGAQDGVYLRWYRQALSRDVAYQRFQERLRKQGPSSPDDGAHPDEADYLR
jgi:glucokinase